jgi:DNA-binding MarR family transcriptional regulator/GNAT superfamily N-acetyltransferase
MDARLAQVRSFNRTVTQRVGALEEAYLTRARPLGQARLLWEIGLQGRDVRGLRADLGLDSGYISRLLRALEREGLVEVRPSPSDARVRTARLTRKGRAERALLDRRSDELAASVLAPLEERQRERLVDAMAEVERLLLASMVRIWVRDPREPAARACLQSYVAELGRRFDGGFDPAHSNPATDADLTPPSGLFLVATLGSDAVGCAGLRLHGDHPAEVKRMWVSPRVRGLGLGRRLLGEVENRAAAQGVRVLRLETNSTLTEAVSLYRSAGYAEVAPFNDERFADHWFEKVLLPSGARSRRLPA